jgi:SAM-dependent methyltransferase
VSEVEACGLVAHPGRPKNWDLLVALGSILERTNTRAAVLDMGAARYSKVLPWLYAFGYRRLAGVDLVPTGLVHTGSIEYLVMDLTATTFPDGAFDAISCLSVIEHGVSPDGYAREVGRLLRPGGIAILSTDFWCSPMDTQGKHAYGVPVHVLTPDEIGTWLEAAARYGLRPVSPVVFGCQDRVVHWKRVDLHFTFIDVVLVKDGGGLRARLGRSRYRRGASPSLPPPADARQGDADDDLSDVTDAP